MRNLQTLIRAEMDERELTYRAVAERARRHGHGISHATVTNYVKGKTRTYTRESLVAIAAGLGVPADRLLRAAEMPMLGEPFELPDEAALLQPHERDAVRSVVNAFIQNRRHRGDSDEEFEVDKADRANTQGMPAPHRPRRAGHDPEWDELYGDYELAAQDSLEGVDPGNVEEQQP